MSRMRVCAGVILAMAVAGLAACDAMPASKSESGAALVPAIDASLTHRYSFTNGAKDSVGKVDGVLKGAAKVQGGKLVLDNGTKGSDDATLSYVDFAASLLPKGTSVSFVFWYAGTTAEQFARVLDIGDKEGVEGRAFIYYTPRTQGGQARAAITATTTANRVFVDSEPIDDGKEHCVVVAIDGGAAKLHVYVDGKEVGTAGTLGENTLDKVRPVHSWIGRSAFDPNMGLTGSINEFRVYNRALSAVDAAAAAKAGPEVVPPAAK